MVERLSQSLVNHHFHAGLASINEAAVSFKEIFQAQVNQLHTAATSLHQTLAKHNIHVKVGVILGVTLAVAGLVALAIAGVKWMRAEQKETPPLKVVVDDGTLREKIGQAALTLMDKFSDEDYKAEGIFRLSGNANDVTKLVENLKNSPDTVSFDDSIETDVKTSALKQLFKDMKLFQATSQKKKCLDVGQKLLNTAISDKEFITRDKEIIHEMKELVEALPPTQQEALKKLLDIFGEVLKHPENQMTSNGLARASTSLLNAIIDLPKHRGEEIQQFQEAMKRSNDLPIAIIENLIEHRGVIFAQKIDDTKDAQGHEELIAASKTGNLTKEEVIVENLDKQQLEVNNNDRLAYLEERHKKQLETMTEDEYDMYYALATTADNLNEDERTLLAELSKKVTFSVEENQELVNLMDIN